MPDVFELSTGDILHTFDEAGTAETTMAKKSYESLQAEIQKLQKEAEAIRAQEVAEVVAKIKSAIAVYGITAKDLGLGTSPSKAKSGPKPSVKAGRRTKSKAKGGRPVKYRDDAGNEWVGFGKRPAWFVAALAAGKTPEDLLAK